MTPEEMYAKNTALFEAFKPRGVIYDFADCLRAYRYTDGVPWSPSTNMVQAIELAQENCESWAILKSNYSEVYHAAANGFGAQDETIPGALCEAMLVMLAARQAGST